jgi:Coenzyme PQQ synthesis protein D (PqqD)
VRLHARARVPEHVVYRTFVRETVVLNLETGRYQGLNVTGGRILDLLVADETVGGAAQRLAEEYRRPLGDVERDVCEFCEDLLDRGLIEMSVNGDC